MKGLSITDVNGVVTVTYQPCPTCAGQGTTITEAMDDLLRQLPDAAGGELRIAVEAAWDAHWETLECEEMAADDGEMVDCGPYIDARLRALADQDGGQ